MSNKEKTSIPHCVLVTHQEDSKHSENLRKRDGLRETGMDRGE
jgi:hypothetical protein